MRMQKLTTGVLGGFAALTAGTMLNPSEASAVALGTPVAQGDHLAVALLTINRVDANGYPETARCTGTLISSTTILTASHCFSKAPHDGPDGALRKPSLAVIGTEDTVRSGGQRRNLLAVKDAPDGVDMAVATLDAPVTTIAPLRLNSAEPKLAQSVEFAGWGKTDDNPSAAWDGTKLNSGQFRVYDVEDDSIDVLGSPNRRTSPCAGDSGGPFMAPDDDGEVRVLATEVEGRACPSMWPDTAARVDRQIDWIMKSVPDLPEQSGPLQVPSQDAPSFNESLFNAAVL